MTPTRPMPLAVIACQVFQDLLAHYLPAELAHEVIYLDYGLHRVPIRLTEAVQAQIDSIETPSLILLGYGLCGNGLDGIQAHQHTLLVARADDCIAILLGSYQHYIELFTSQPGTYYLTKGWLESGSDPLKEYREYEAKYGEEKALWLMDMQYQHYRRLIFVAHTQEDLETYRPRALEVAAFCERWGMVYEEILGSDAYVRQLAEMAAHITRGNNHTDPGADFLLVPPGGQIKQSDFLRMAG